MALAEPGYLLISVDLRRRLLILLIFQRATLLASLWAIECLTCLLLLLAEPSLGAVVAFDLVDVFMKHLKYDTLFFGKLEVEAGSRSSRAGDSEIKSDFA